MTLGANVLAARKALKWTLGDLSEASGVEVGTIHAMESRNSKKSDYAAALATALGVSLEELLADTLDTDEVVRRVLGPRSAATPSSIPAPATSLVPAQPGPRYLVQRLADLLVALDPLDRRQAAIILGELAVAPEQAEVLADKLVRLLGELQPPTDTALQARR